ncbi:MAG: DUF4281 domain-containing protein [Gammaproteobacteria bacterium]|nr:DUF4281 domain-containing protein [Gammaproteobacteria bacterium]
MAGEARSADRVRRTLFCRSAVACAVRRRRFRQPVLGARIVPERLLLLAGWIHYLLFDFFVGAWIVAASAASRVPRLLVIACLSGCFLAGPIGLLAYVLIRIGNRLWPGEPQLA